MFHDSLRQIVHGVEGGMAALLMGFDGIAVESYARTESGLDIQSVGMEFSFILTQVRKAAQVLELGGIREVAIRAERAMIVMRVLTGEYFIALALEPHGNFGKGRYLLRAAAPKMAAEL